MKYIHYLALAALCAFCGTTHSRAVPITRDKPQQQAGLARLLDRVSLALKNQQAIQPGWKDQVIEDWLEALVTAANKEAKAEVARIPVRFADLSQIGAKGAGGQHAALIVSKDFSGVSAEKSIVLAEGNVKVSFANDSVIIARGAVEVSHGRGNLIVAGQFIHVSHDGDARMPGRGSFLVSGSVVDVSHSHGSVCYAPTLMRISHAKGSVLFNAPNREISHTTNTQDGKLPKDLIGQAPDHPLSKRLQVQSIITGKGAVFLFNGKRYIADLNSELVDEAGKPIQELVGWKCSYVSEGYALFSKGKEGLGIVVK